MKSARFSLAEIVLMLWGSLIFCSNVSVAQTVMFYNCENLFDPLDDPNTSDNEYLPNSRRNWTWEKYRKKLENISKVILATGEEPPAVIGLAEVENAFVLSQLVNKTGLVRFGYKIIHHDSPDPRGIDIGALYWPERFRLLYFTYYRVGNDEKLKDRFRTRDILYLKGILCSSDTLHVFYNHWPSRRSNASSENKEENRIIVAKVLRSKVDSILKKNILARIIIMGDFNDEPHNTSIVKYLKAEGSAQNSDPFRLYNWSTEWIKNSKWIGTYKFKNQWIIIDQIITSQSFVSNKNKQKYCMVSRAEIFAPPFLLTDDEKFGTKKPLRTYNGMKYLGGFSDHLPVLLRFECRSCQAR